MKYIVFMAIVIALSGCSTKEINSTTDNIVGGMKDIANEGCKAVNSSD